MGSNPKTQRTTQEKGRIANNIGLEKGSGLDSRSGFYVVFACSPSANGGFLQFVPWNIRSSILSIW